MNTKDKVAVTSRSFSCNSVLREELSKKYKHVTFNSDGRKLSGESLIHFLQGHSKAITALEIIDEYVLSHLSELRVISKFGVGIDMLDINALRHRQISLGWFRGVNRRSVAELTISFAISLLRAIPSSSRELAAGKWRQHVGGYLSGKTVGIIGCGFIGKDLIKLLQAFKCEILVNDIQEFPDFYNEYKVKSVVLEDLLGRSDIVTLHVPLDENTRNLLDARRLNLMKRGSVLINTARGGLVDERHVKEMLQDGRLLGAAFDVFSVEPPLDYELLNLPNFLGTPHIGGSAYEAILSMGRAAIAGLDENAIP